MKYADIILPLAIERNYTFGIPLELQQKIQIGCRVEVQFGAKKIYSGIVKTIHNNKPDVYDIKPILNLLDDEPIVTESQLAFWAWMAAYYCCTEGEVMAAALPAHLKLVSDTYLIINEEVLLHEHELTDDEFMLLQALEIKQTQKKNNTASNETHVP
jgi:primosomal protein N' (replication factor Y) (superfamily II helicase)